MKFFKTSKNFFVVGILSFVIFYGSGLYFFKYSDFWWDIEEKSYTEEKRLFDEKYYSKEYEKFIKRTKYAPFRHFMKMGWKRNFNPNPWFKSFFYKKYFLCKGNQLSDFLKQHSGVQKGGYDKELIASLTTSKKTVQYAWFFIESIMRQSIKPNRIILWTPSNIQIPESLKILQKRGLEIKFIEEDFNQVNNVIYPIKEFKDSLIYTVVDCFFYYPNNLELLYKAYLNNNKKNIYTYRSYDILDGNSLVPIQYLKNIKENSEKIGVVPLTCYGALFSSESLDKTVTNGALFKKLSIHFDDFWYFVMAFLENTPIYNVKKTNNCGIIKIEHMDDHLNDLSDQTFPFMFLSDNLKLLNKDIIDLFIYFNLNKKGLVLSKKFSLDEQSNKILENKKSAFVLAGYQLMYDLDKVFRYLGIDYFIEGGTLLGAIRHGGFIPWDIDFDVIAISDKEKLEKAKEIFIKSGYQIGYYDSNHTSFRVAKLYSKSFDGFKKPENFVYCDVLIASKNKDKFVVDLEPKGIYLQNEILPLKRIKFGGIMLNAPKNCNHVLDILYGKNWMNNLKDYSSRSSLKHTKDNFKPLGPFSPIIKDNIVFE